MCHLKAYIRLNNTKRFYTLLVFGVLVSAYLRFQKPCLQFGLFELFGGCVTPVERKMEAVAPSERTTRVGLDCRRGPAIQADDLGQRTARTEDSGHGIGGLMVYILCIKD